MGIEVHKEKKKSIKKNIKKSEEKEMQIINLDNLTNIIQKQETKKNEYSKFRPEMVAGGTTIEVFPTNTLAVIQSLHSVKTDKYASFYRCLEDHQKGSCEICNAMKDTYKMVAVLAKEEEDLVNDDKKEETRKKVYREEMSTFESEFFNKSEPYVYIASVEIDANYKKNGNVLTPKNVITYDLNGEEVTVPAFEIKIKRMRVSALTKLKESFETDGYTLQGGVLFTKYGNETNKMLLGKNKVQQVLDLNIFKDYPKMMEVINDMCNKTFKVTTEDGSISFDTSIFSEVYPELKVDRRPYKFEDVMERALGKWYKYQEHITLNPNKTFTSFRVENPSVPTSTSTSTVPEAPTAPEAPNVPLNTAVTNNDLTETTNIGGVVPNVQIDMGNFPF